LPTIPEADIKNESIENPESINQMYDPIQRVKEMERNKEKLMQT